ncbi:MULTISPECIES: MBL fold metallo-hydrolase [Clostridium]|uniref:L-ascorbate metabolism protein UlaG, beta-lactamase superfamily n=1 Tax=Clostridium cadaveris TaxID=1529 RepID=A0A1I2Q6L0_9CLOT|nr:MBL fold metallo-hydrolase [Clostridium cadaveris]MDU4953509.1 MBL fold metallo-hydrolase [Clostridium sp.]MDM8311216.1 MBL fold metallo-hydrolase [Clostridium cadaveris]MDY4947958.1 MBL fold metallo-hydrolase [Clostridium cadaveris]NME66107.1 MBL fold metallo-hydrolase [Clostridium cadaveris]NWK12672.1 MBL fold metallo-hydrolase [Clostridium cadaveris]
MKIIYLGHSSFILQTAMGRKILIDPFKCAAIEKNLIGTVNLITVSHCHSNHNYTEPFKENIKIIDAVGTYEDKDLRISGLPSFHDNINGLKRGENIIFLYEFDGFKICHLGDLGHIPDKETLCSLKDLDILLIPVGGNFTLDSKEACTLCNMISPKVIIPMHYKFMKDGFDIKGAEDFIFDMKNGERLSDSSLSLNFMPDCINAVFVMPPLQ